MGTAARNHQVSKALSYHPTDLSLTNHILGPDTSKSSSEGAAAAAAQKNKANGNGHQHHGPITQLKEKVSKVLHHNGNGNGNGTKA